MNICIKSHFRVVSPTYKWVHPSDHSYPSPGYTKHQHLSDLAHCLSTWRWAPRNLWMCHPCDPFDGKDSDAAALPEYCNGPPGAMLRLGLEPLAK